VKEVIGGSGYNCVHLIPSTDAVAKLLVLAEHIYVYISICSARGVCEHIYNETVGISLDDCVWLERNLSMDVIRVFSKTSRKGQKHNTQLGSQKAY
jgi:hypothetical protein